MADKNRYLTTGERIRNFTGWAFAIAILIELVLAPFYHNPNAPHAEATEPPITIARQTIKPPPTPPPPTPTPPPTPQPQKVQQHPQPQQPRLKLNVFHSHAAGPGNAQPRYVAPKTGTENGNPNGTAATAPPAPPATPASCPDPDREATTVDRAQPDYPDSAQEEGLGAVEVAVEVTIGPSGGLESASILSSSGNAAIDHDALRVARLTTYAPKLVNCQPVTSSYKYLVDYNPD